jgi:hypothetical protein
VADIAISDLARANPSPGHLLPYSTGNNTLATPVSAIFQNFELASFLGIGTTNPIRQLHLASPGQSIEQIWEQLNGVPDYRKWNLVINNGNNAPGIKSSIVLRQLNDAGTGGNVVWSYDATLSAHNVSGPKQLMELRDYGTSQTAFTTIQTTKTIVCMGYISIAANSLPVADFIYDQIDPFEFRLFNTSSNYNSVSWDLGTGGSSIEDTVTFIFPAETELFSWQSIILTANNSCGSVTFIDSVQFSLESVSTISRDAVRFYPNPATSQLKLEVSKTAPSKVLIFNALGKKVLQENVHESGIVDIQSLSEGMYILLIEQNGILQSGKFIKNNF